MMANERELFARRRVLSTAFGAVTTALIARTAPLDAMSRVDASGRRERGGESVNVRDRGAQGDGRHDDTEAIQSAIDSLPEGGGTVHLPDGRYLVDPLQSLRLRSNMHLSLASNAKLEAKPNAADRAYMLLLHRVENVEISGGLLLGERSTHLGTTGEWGHGIQLRGASRVTIRNTRISECWGDGICIGDARIGRGKSAVQFPSTDVLISHVSCIENRRQGLSIGHSRNVRVLDSEFTGTHGTPPAYGIDIEPDQGDDVRGVRIERCVIRGNQGGGIQVYKRSADVSILDNAIERNLGYGILVIGGTGGRIERNKVMDNALAGVAMRQGAQDFKVIGNVLSGHPRKRDLEVLKSASRIVTSDNRVIGKD